MGLRYMILIIKVKKLCLEMELYVIRNASFTFDFKKIIRLNAMLSRFHSRGRTHDAGSVMRIAFLV